MYYIVGGVLKYNHPSYVARKTDHELLELLQAGEYCLVLKSRQMGKSSLRVQTRRKLKELGTKSAFIDLILLGNSSDEETIIKGVASQLLSSLDLETELNLQRWWEEYQHLTPLQKLDKLIESVILVKIKQKIVIFIDEIDWLLNIPQKDNFFAFIRACYNKRADHEEYERLCFCLLGVISPANLIQDKKSTPFNIGRSINLTGLTFPEAKDALVPGLIDVVDCPEETLQQILDWTGGQPFLTQKLCDLTVKHAKNKQANISEIVTKYIIEGWEHQDVPEHLRTIRNRITDDETKTIQLLGLYQEILEGSEVRASQNEEQIQLILSGLVVKQGDNLQIYNPIYEAIFNADWIKEQLDNLRPYSEEINNWIRSNKNEQYLLQGEALSEAQQWSETRKLSNIDYQFLSTSQAFKARQEQEAKDMLAIAYRKGKKILFATIGIASAIILGSTIFAQITLKNTQITKMNTSSIEAEQKFDVGQQLIGLISAIQSTGELQKVVKNSNNLAKYPTAEPLKSLNEILNHIRAKNQIQLSNQAISTLTFASDGKSIIAGSHDGAVTLWNSQDNQVQNLHNLENKITKIVHSSDRQTIIFADEGGAIYLSDRDGIVNNILAVENVSSFNISPDGKYIVVGDNRGNLSLWTKDGTLLKKPDRAHQGSITSIAFSPDGEVFASGSNDTLIKLWTKEGEEKAILSGHTGIVNKVAFNPDKDNQILASGSSDGTIKLWTIKDEIPKILKDLTDHKGGVESIAFSPDGLSLISGSSDKTIKLWNIGKSARETGTLRETWNGHQDTVNSVIFSPDGQTIASGDRDGKVILWQTPPHQTKSIGANTFSEDRQSILVSQLSTIGSQFTLKNLEGRIIKTIPPLPHKIITSIAMSPDGQTIVAGRTDGIIEQINLDRGTEGTWNVLNSDWGYEGEVIAMDFHPDGESFVSVGIDRSNPDLKYYTVRLWDKNGQFIQNMNNDDEKPITAVSFSPQGEELAIARKDGAIELWQTDGTSRKILVNGDNDPNIQKNITSINFSPDGKFLVTASYIGADGSPFSKTPDDKGKIQLRHSDGTFILDFELKERKIINVDFSQDSKTILAVDDLGFITNWNLDLDILLQRGCEWLKDYSRTAANFPLEICDSVR